MNFHVITLFPDSMSGYINESIIGRAISDKKINVKFYNPRDFVKDKNRRIDQKPYGGGPGMVIQAEPIIKAIEKISNLVFKKNKTKKLNSANKIKIIFLTPGGKLFDTNFAKKIVQKTKITDLIIICGRYEGIDERVNKIFKTEKISVGPFVLTGGELPALILIDCISRQIDGVLGNELSREEDRVSSNKVYTRPEILDFWGKKYKVPKVLLSGNHKKIELWKSKN
ncbi:MAG TPA: tRNA (guanosine(37)-N1)-methyltransferase TrmD [Candidatus Paceibacterota bacterium]|nr:tRNA (guanosine(37)-N1)-methyltransferase TrmD [Candidatus Paceibacterota bacterium]HMP18798.1 tRNA (guanosine(37)-N1)-methyltransferase TrmD [Candidatus Paceibacterota bacterium]HMP85584.1 tRNA (guanosine(37)-N1)-methyltransferase TrmD [Candidatus Paceibacterota bacterium]